MKTGWAVLTAFASGAVVGGIAGLLFAPEKGEEQRKRIKNALKKHGAICKEELHNIINKSKEGISEDFDVE